MVCSGDVWEYETVEPRFVVLRGDHPLELAPRMEDVVVGGVAVGRTLVEPESGVWSLMAIILDVQAPSVDLVYYTRRVCLNGIDDMILMQGDGRWDDSNEMKEDGDRVLRSEERRSWQPVH